MAEGLITAGIILIAAAIVGGGLKVFKIKISIINSFPRQLLLAFLGVVSVIIGIGIISNRIDVSNTSVETVATVELSAHTTVLPTSTQQFSFTSEWATEPEIMGSFSLELTQDEGKITGTHIAVASGGDRIDSFIDDPSIIGTIREDGVGVVTFNSSFLGRGKATMLLDGGNTIIWAITESEGEHWLPMDAMLHKVDD